MEKAVSPLLALAGFSLLTSLSPAAVVALWDSTTTDYATTNNAVFGATTQSGVDLGLGAPGTDDFLEVMSFGPFPASETVPNPYVGPALFGGFYAASSEAAGTPGNFNYAVIIRNNPDEMRLQNSFAGSTQRVWRSVVYLPSDPFTLEGATLTLGTGAGAGVDHHFHYVVRSDDKFYVSQDFFTVNGASAPAVGTYNPHPLVVDSDTTLWKEWDFSLNSGNNFQVDFSGTVTLPENALVDAVGFFMRSDTTGTTTSIQTNVRFIGYEAAIPEPAWFAPALALAALGLTRRRRAAVS